jgi:heme-degrading monooxygenase HmoA
MKHDAGFAYVWEYRVEESALEEFLDAYCPEGEWVRLFEKAEGYFETELLSDEEDPLRYVTIDRWRTKEYRDSFREKFAVEFAELDERCESLTVEEKFIGDFEICR